MAEAEPLPSADHTDEGSGGDSQRSDVNDNVIYRSRPELASGNVSAWTTPIGKRGAQELSPRAPFYGRQARLWGVMFTAQAVDRPSPARNCAFPIL